MKPWADMDRCPLRSAAVQGSTPRECVRLRVCYLCGSELPQRRQRWCSDRCVAVWVRNHTWTSARHFATVRARSWRAEGMASVEHYPWRDDSEEIRLIWESRPLCERCLSSTTAIEINHVVPRNGGGYDNGCHHHQTNLEPLCHPCHVAETTEQARARRGGRPPAPVRNALPEPLWSAA